LDAEDLVRTQAPQLASQEIRFEPNGHLLVLEHHGVGSEHVFVARPRSFTLAEFTDAVARSRTMTETLRTLGLRPAGGNFGTFRKYARLWNVSTEHFDPAAVARENRRARGRRVALEDVMIEHSTYSRAHLKTRLLDDGMKQRRCEFCGQDERWRGQRMALILDHVNGVGDDNRLENLRILCPNCAATLDTHCARKNRIVRDPIECARCGLSFVPRFDEQRYCSRSCGSRWLRPPDSHDHLRRVERPPYEQLVAEVRADGFSAVGRRYGVSDNAIRKWIRRYERELSCDPSA
jgi:hypothetical protein